MSRDSSPHEALNRHRSSLLAIAYRLLGGVAGGRILALRLALDPGKACSVPSLERFGKEIWGWTVRRSS